MAKPPRRRRAKGGNPVAAAGGAAAGPSVGAPGAIVEATAVVADPDFRLLVENSLGLMCVHDPAGVIVYMSPPAAQALGRTPEDMVGRSLRGYLSPMVEHLFDAYLDRIEREGSDSGLMVMQAKDGGELIWQYRNVRLSVPGGPPRVYGHGIDVTERVRAEQALRRTQKVVEESQTRHQSLVEGSPLGVCIHQDGVIQFANRALARMHGALTPEDLVGQPFSSLLAPAECPRVEAHVAALLAGEPVSEDMEVEHLTRAGRPLWAETWSAVVVWNQALAVLVTVIDASERKRLEAKVRAMERMEAVAQLAGGIAHECNNLMSVVLGRAELLRNTLDGTDPRLSGIDVLMRAGRRASTLAQQLLAYSRRLSLSMERLDLGEIVRGMEPRLQSATPGGVALTFEIAADVWPVDADAAQLEAMVMHLVRNAVQAMPGGGRLLVQVGNVDLDAAFVQQHTGSRGGEHVLITVKDTGVGMSPEALAHVFEPFFSNRGIGEGMGLGLPSVYGIVKQHGGYVTVESAPGTGTAVRMYFPRTSA
jgi:PAS domain S-box-containing protein